MRERESAPEAFAGGDQRGLRFDVNIAIHLDFARQPQIILVADPGEEGERAKHQADPFEESLLADVFGPLGDVHATTGAASHSHAIHVVVGDGIDLDTFPQGHLPQVFTRGTFDFAFFLDEVDGGHGRDEKEEAVRTINSE